MTDAISLPKLHISAGTVRSLCMVLCFVMVLSFTLVLNTEVAFCETTPAETDSSASIDQLSQIGTVVASAIYRLIRSVITPMVIIAFAAAGLQFLLGGNQGTEKAKKIILGACAGLILVVFAPQIGDFLGSQFAAYGGDDLSNFNPLD